MSESELEGLLIRLALGSIIGTVYAGFAGIAEPRLTMGVISVIGGLVCLGLGIITILGIELAFNRLIGK